MYCAAGGALMACMAGRRPGVSLIGGAMALGGAILVNLRSS
jgi:hypothetical protein